MNKKLLRKLREEAIKSQLEKFNVFLTTRKYVRKCINYKSQEHVKISESIGAQVRPNRWT
jgi:hypothetical protein